MKGKGKQHLNLQSTKKKTTYINVTTPIYMCKNDSNATRNQ
jgi:hypothetical protein